VNRQQKLLLVLSAAAGLFLFSRTKLGQRGITYVTDKARHLIAGLEGRRLTVYQDTGGAWTIGDGHLVKAGERFYPYGTVRTITDAEADALFAADIAIASSAINSYVKVPLTEGQRAALLSLVFNIGVSAFKTSTMLKKLNAGDYAGAAAEFPRWNKDNGVTVAGLTNRRVREQSVFNA
jgi:lysozyme